MAFLVDALNDWLKPILIDGIHSNLQDLFSMVNSKMDSVTTLVSQTPKEWNDNIFTMVQNISNTVVLPVAGAVIAAVMAMELIQMILEKNNQQDTDLWMVFKWILKSFFAVSLVTNSWTIVMGIFDMGKELVVGVTALIGDGSTAIDISEKLPGMMLSLEGDSLGHLLGMYLLSIVFRLTGIALAMFIYVVLFGRIIEIFMVVSVAPLTMATTFNRSWGNIGTNYIRLLLSLALQGLLIMVAVAIYISLISHLPEADELTSWLVTIIGYTALLCFSLAKTGGLAKSLFGAH